MTEAPFDFGTVAVKTAELPADSRGRKSKYDGPNPFSVPLAESYEAWEQNQNGSNVQAGRQIRVPGSAVMDAVYLLRRASNDLNIGVRIVVQDSQGKRVEAKPESFKKANGEWKAAQFTVLFQGKNRKQKKEDTEETPDVPEADEDGPTEG